MKTSNQPSTALAQFLAPPESQAAPDNLFYAHGVMAPGVKLMRNLQFAGKSVLISLTFLVPVLVLAWSVWGDYSVKREANLLELEGVQLLQSFGPVNQHVSASRDAARARLGGYDSAASLKASQTAAQAAMAKAEKEISQSSMSIPLIAAFKEIRKQWDAALASGNLQSADGRNVFAPAAKSSIQFIQQVGDDSGAVLDPEVDTLYLVLLTTQTMPNLVNSLGEVRSIGTFVASKSDALAGEEWQKELLLFAVYDAELRSSIADYKSFVSKVVGAKPELKSKLDTSFIDRIEAYRAKAYAAITSRSNLAAAELWNNGTGLLDESNATNGKLLTLLGELIQARQHELNVEHYPLFAVSVLALLLAAYFFMSFYLVTRGGLRLISNHLNEVAAGDLRKAPSKPWGTDEPAMVILDLRKTYESLHALIRKLRHSARALHAASNGISAASQDLAGRTEAAASSLAEQASAMEEIGATVASTAERANMASTFASENADVAEQGGKVFDQVVATMQEIQNSSSKIGDIISVIDGIAFQTNILALNAAVEAARAGESGRGFAVVASEVRSLAQRSAEAAREIKSLISVTVEKVEAGTVVVADAGRTMTDVVTNARQINTFLSEIAIAAKEQAAGVVQVGQAIQELDRNTQQNAALVEQTTAAGASLTQQAEILQEEIANFRVA